MEFLKRSFLAATLATGAVAAGATGIEGPSVVPTYEVKTSTYSGDLTVTPRGKIVLIGRNAPPEIHSCVNHPGFASAFAREIGKIVENIEDLPLNNDEADPAFVGDVDTTLSILEKSLTACARTRHKAPQEETDAALKDVSDLKSRVSRLVPN